MQVLKSRSFTKINLKRLNSNVERLFAKIGCLREIWLGFIGQALGEISYWAWLGFPKLLSLLPSAPSTHTCKHINIRVFFLFLFTLVFKEKDWRLFCFLVVLGRFTLLTLSWNSKSPQKYHFDTFTTFNLIHVPNHCNQSFHFSWLC